MVWQDKIVFFQTLRNWEQFINFIHMLYLFTVFFFLKFWRFKNMTWQHVSDLSYWQNWAFLYSYSSV